MKHLIMPMWKWRWIASLLIQPWNEIAKMASN